MDLMNFLHSSKDGNRPWALDSSSEIACLSLSESISSRSGHLTFKVLSKGLIPFSLSGLYFSVTK
jgi:hypothetical protein